MPLITRRQLNGFGLLTALGVFPRALWAQASRPALSKEAAKAAKLKAEKAQLADTDAFFERLPIPRIKVEIAAPEMDALRKEARTYAKCVWREAIPGQENRVLKDVAVRLKGAAGSFRGVDDRPALTVNFEKHSPGRNWRGLEKLHLNNSVQDGTLLSEFLGGMIMRAAGIPAARTTHAKLWLNDRDMGIYVLKEGFDDVFLRKSFEDGGGPLYDGGFLRDIDQELSVMSNKDKKDYARLKLLVAASNEPNPAARKEKLAKILDVERFITLMALEAMTAHWDGYVFNRNNYRVYDDPKTGKFVFLPHGMDQLFQQPAHGLFGGAGMVARCLSDTPEARDVIFDRIETLRKTVFNQQKIDGWIEAATIRLAAVAKEQGGDGAVNHHVGQAREMKRRIGERIKFIDAQVAARPRPLKFDRNGLAALEGWALLNTAGEAKLEQVAEGGRRIYRITGQGAINASIRKTVILGAGKYALIGQCRAVGVKAEAGDNTGVGLRISGGKRTTRLVGDSAWTTQAFEFEVPAMGEVVLIGEIAAQQGSALFDSGTLKLKRR